VCVCERPKDPCEDTNGVETSQLTHFQKYFENFIMYLHNNLLNSLNNYM